MHGDFEKGCSDMAKEKRPAATKKSSSEKASTTHKTKPAAAKPATAKGAASKQASSRASAGKQGRSASAKTAAVSHDQIATRAYDIWVTKGRPVGQDLQNWREAEAQLLSSLR
jgi:hypothetical protein